MIIFGKLNDIPVLVFVTDLNTLIHASSDEYVSYIEEISEQAGSVPKGCIEFIRVDQDKRNPI